MADSSSVQRINTAGVQTAATSLRRANDNINSQFGTLKATASRIEDEWKGTAAALADTKLQGILKNAESRSTVMQNYIDFLEQQVNPGYTAAENTNKKLADQFR